MYCKHCGSEISSKKNTCATCGNSQDSVCEKQIENYDALIRRANKMVTEFNRYPLMPKGDLSIKFIENVFQFNPLFVLDNLKKAVLNMLLEQTNYQYDEQELLPLLEETYGKHEAKHKKRILDTLINNYQHDVDAFRFKHWSYMMLRPEETLVFYYAFSIFYIARDLNSSSGLLVARKVLQGVQLFYCEKGTTPFDSIDHTGKLLNLSEFSADRAVYDKLMRMVENEIEANGSEDCKQQLRQEKQEDISSKKGCYIATCIYGSYDCPQVWTLRRFRDFSLLKSQCGKLFVWIYYAVSPWLVKRFGRANWFHKLWKPLLNSMVEHLQEKGVESTPYDDTIA